MLLSEVLREKTVKMRLRAMDKTHAIEELVDKLIEAGEIPMVLRGHVLDIVMEREKSTTTGVGNGVAIPHGGTERIPNVVGTLGLAPNGINFECRDGLPSTIIVLLVIPRKSFQDHIHTMASVSRVLSNPSLRSALLSAPDAAAVLKLIKDQEAQITQRRGQPK